MEEKKRKEMRPMTLEKRNFSLTVSTVKCAIAWPTPDERDAKLILEKAEKEMGHLLKIDLLEEDGLVYLMISGKEKGLFLRQTFSGGFMCPMSRFVEIFDRKNKVLGYVHGNTDGGTWYSSLVVDMP